MNYEVETIVKELEALEEKNKDKKPCVAVNQLLKKMSAEPVYSNDELKEYADELWMTAQQFEKEL